MNAQPLLCWCCAVWGITTPAIVADKRLCAYCLPRSPRCKDDHIDEALGTTTGPQPDLFATPHP